MQWAHEAEIGLCYRETGILCAEGTCGHCDGARLAARRAAGELLEKDWRFWNVGSKWFAKRYSGEQITAGTYAAVRQKAEWFEQNPY